MDSSASIATHLPMSLWADSSALDRIAKARLFADIFDMGFLLDFFKIFTQDLLLVVLGELLGDEVFGFFKAHRIFTAFILHQKGDIAAITRV